MSHRDIAEVSCLVLDEGLLRVFDVIQPCDEVSAELSQYNRLATT